jgi:hypothetical protein
MQQLRGRLYLEDGAVGKGDLSRDGHHVLPSDDRSWHLLVVNRAGDVLGCTRYLLHSPRASFDDLGVRETVLADSNEWGAKLRAAVEEELSCAREAGFSYVEIGGWAMDPEVRRSAECLRSVLATYAWSRILGGARGICTATERNGSASILRKLGGRSLEWDSDSIPPYFDPHYNCRMHILGFDSRHPNPKYEESIEEIRESLLNVPVICPERPIWKTIIDGISSRHEPLFVNELAV